MVVRMRSNHSHTANRRAHHRLSKPAVSIDPASKVPHLRHRVSLTTGEYRGRKVINVQAKLEKRLAKDKAKNKES